MVPSSQANRNIVSTFCLCALLALQLPFLLAPYSRYIHVLPSCVLPLYGLLRDVSRCSKLTHPCHCSVFVVQGLPYASSVFFSIIFHFSHGSRAHRTIYYMNKRAKRSVYIAKAIPYIFVIQTICNKKFC